MLSKIFNKENNELEENVKKLEEIITRLLKRLEFVENEIQSLKSSNTRRDSNRTSIRMIIYFRNEELKILNCIITSKVEKIIGKFNFML